MKIDLNGLSRKELLALQKRVEAALQRTVERERKEALAALEKAAKAHGFTIDEVVQAKPQRRSTPRKKAKPSPAKYANPSDKAQTWTGKGRQPKWFKEALAGGATPESLTVS